MLIQFLSPTFHSRTSVVASHSPGSNRSLTTVRTVGGRCVLMNQCPVGARRVTYESEMLHFLCDSKRFLAGGWESVFKPAQDQGLLVRGSPWDVCKVFSGLWSTAPFQRLEPGGSPVTLHLRFRQGKFLLDTRKVFINIHIFQLNCYLSTVVRQCQLASKLGVEWSIVASLPILMIINIVHVTNHWSGKTHTERVTLIKISIDFQIN